MAGEIAAKRPSEWTRRAYPGCERAQGIGRTEQGGSLAVMPRTLPANAIACVQIGSNPQTEVNVGDGTFCAEKAK